MNIIKRIGLTMAGLSIMAPLAAEEAEGMTIIMRNGDATSMTLDMVDRIELGDGTVTVVAKGSPATGALEIALIDRITFGKVSSISAVDEMTEVTMTIDGELMILRGDFTSSTVDLYDLSGRRLLSAAVESGEAMLDLTGYGAGVYIVSAGKFVQKINKK